MRTKINLLVLLALLAAFTSVVAQPLPPVPQGGVVYFPGTNWVIISDGKPEWTKVQVNGREYYVTVFSAPVTNNGWAVGHDLYGGKKSE